MKSKITGSCASSNSSRPASVSAISVSATAAVESLQGVSIRAIDIRVIAEAILINLGNEEVVPEINAFNCLF